MRSPVPPTRGVWTASALLASFAAVAMCWAVVGNVGGRAPGTLVELQQRLGGLPPISSTCLSKKTACIISVPGGSLRLTGIKFRKDEGYGSAMAVGFVNGQFVSGKVQMRRPDSEEWPVKTSGGQSLADKKKEESPTEEETPAAEEPKTEEPAEEGEAKEEEKEPAEESNAKEGEKEPAGEGEDGEESEQYKVALEAVEAHMEARQKRCWPAPLR